MIESDKTILIEKFLNHEISEEDAEKLSEWLEEDDTHLEVFNSHIEISQLLQERAHNFDSTAAYQKIAGSMMQNRKNQKRTWKYLLKYAAIFIGIIGLGVYFFNTDSTNIITEGKSNIVILELENGEVKKINSDNQKSIFNNKGQIIGSKGKNSLNYETGSPMKKLVYNTLRIPNGRIFELILSDGSRVMLNSGSIITYPTHFQPNKKRNVFLVGEAYFQVAEDSTRQFVVNTRNQKVVVYGTKFNVSAYKNEAFTKTVLVQGSVGVINNENEIKLVPGEMSILGSDGDAIEIRKVKSSDYIAWIQNEIIFESQSFSSIIKTLERKFDVTIHNEYEALNNQIFTATFKDKKIDAILRLFSKSRSFDFTIKGNIITIKKPQKE